jgi:phosphatidate cytidylyltransferase
VTRNTVLRLLVFFLGIPLLGLAAVAFPEHNLPFFGVLVIIASAVAAFEAAFFFPPHTRDYPGNRYVIPALGALVPAVGFASLYLPAEPAVQHLSSATVLLITLTLAISAIMAVQVLKRREVEIFQIITVVNTHVFLLIYPGLFTWHAVQIISLPNPSMMLIVFVLAVYMNDSMAWLVGRLLGPLTRKADAPPPVAISPNKSMAGFIGGFLASPLVILIAGAAVPGLFPGGIFPRLVLGALIGISSILGDLVESAFKRSAVVKDSGQLIPGRGGLLDSIDSPLFAAPFFYYSVVIIFAL